MKQIIKLYDIYHADLFSCAKASILADMISLEADTVILDFDGITPAQMLTFDSQDKLADFLVVQ